MYFRTSGHGYSYTLLNHLQHLQDTSVSLEPKTWFRHLSYDDPEVMHFSLPRLRLWAADKMEPVSTQLCRDSRIGNSPMVNR